MYYHPSSSGFPVVSLVNFTFFLEMATRLGWRPSVPRLVHNLLHLLFDCFFVFRAFWVVAEHSVQLCQQLLRVDRRAPLVFKLIRELTTRDKSVLYHGVWKACGKLEFGRLEWIVVWKVDIQVEYTTLVRCAFPSLNCDLPCFDIVLSDGRRPAVREGTFSLGFQQLTIDSLVRRLVRHCCKRFRFKR